ncbi:thrombomodulin-like [Brachionichthys hirsutus]|uniref:thrombomodulin-like n=1 Tax=Brachionichthys hirsutus TaxID=412623 RepID=UPI00360531C0
MKGVTRLLRVLLTLLMMGRAGGIAPSGGYCVGNQCVTVFQHPSDFQSAEAACVERGGYLATVRSTVARDVVFILLATRPGRFWIGLHRPTGCPDAAAELRGFRWVTGDNRSDYTGWATTFDGGCSSPRCVSVSAEDVEWNPVPCRAEGGFLCEHSFKGMCGNLEVGTRGDGTREDGTREDVSYEVSTLGFESADTLSLPPGSVAITNPWGVKFICFSGRWLPAPWSCEIRDGGCAYKCATDPKHAPSCYCAPGRAVNPRNNVTCEEAAEDPCLLLRCAHACYKTGDGYACTCDHGFKLAQDGRACVDVNDCADERQCPRENFACVNTVGGFQCVCEDGFRLTGDQCVDVDECTSAPCEHVCANTPGGFHCSCYDGYKEDPKSPTKCELFCADAECAAVCDPNDGAVCFCPLGYILEERSKANACMDIDECAFGYCDQECENAFGSYACACSPGYTLVNGYRCVKNDDDADADGGTAEGSGASTMPNYVITSRRPAVPHPEPTRQPSELSVGGLVGIIVATVLVVVSVVFLAHCLFNGGGKMESAEARKAPERDAHGLRHVTSNT